MKTTRLVTLSVIILGAAATRLIPHPWNFAPIAAMALFGGAHFSNKRLALLVPAVAMLLSDLVIGFHSQMIAVYTSFALVVCIGYWLRSHRGVSNIIGATLTSSVLFFAVTNLGVWAFDALYPKTGAGLIACYTAAIPFFQNTLLGDLLYTGAMFGLFALAERSVPFLRESPAPSAC